MMTFFSAVLEKTINILIIIFSILIIGSVLLEVIFRYLVNSSLFWSNELSVLFYVWMIFLGMPILIKKNKLMQIDFTSIFPPLVKTWIKIFKEMISIIIMILFVIVGFTSELYTVSGQILTSTGIPLIWKHIIVPISSLFALFFILERTTKKIIQKRRGDLSE